MSQQNIIVVIFSIASSAFSAVLSENYKFPDDFKFGVATSSYQIEGAWNVDGKTPSIWDDATHNRSHLIKDKSNGDIACDSYHKWEEDMKMIKHLGVDYYRFSVSWPRIFPEGYTNKINNKGVEYYSKIIDKLLENGVQPVVTLYHWELPKKFAILGGWNNPIIIDLFARYARKIFELFGDRVKMWITINEPRMMCQMFMGLVGDSAHEYPTGVAEYLCTHNILKAHAEAYHIYDKEFRPKQKGKVSLSLDMTWWEPENKSNPEDVRTAERNMQFDIGLFANPIINFNYPKMVLDRVAKRSKLEGFAETRLPKLRPEDEKRIHGTYDFLGINHYMTMLVKANHKESQHKKPNMTTDTGGYKYYDPEWEHTGFEMFKVVPSALRKLLKWIKKTYGNPEILITENGYADSTDIIEDNDRIDYYNAYLKEVLEAIFEDNVNITGYITWTLMDDFEWFWGYKTKFGLYHVNFTDPNRTRTPKKSVDYYRNIIKTRRIK